MWVKRNQDGSCELMDGADPNASAQASEAEAAPVHAPVIHLPTRTTAQLGRTRPLDSFVQELEARLAELDAEIEKRKTLESERRRIKRLLKAASSQVFETERRQIKRPSEAAPPKETHHGDD